MLCLLVPGSIILQNILLLSYHCCLFNVSRNDLITSFCPGGEGCCGPVGDLLGLTPLGLQGDDGHIKCNSKTWRPSLQPLGPCWEVM